MAFDAWSKLYNQWCIVITQVKFHLSGWSYQNTAPAVASHQKRPWGWQDYAQTWNKANFRKHNTQECQVTSLFHCINIFTPKVCWKSSNPRYFCFTVFRIVPDLRKMYFYHKLTSVYHLFWSVVGFPSFSGIYDFTPANSASISHESRMICDYIDMIRNSEPRKYRHLAIWACQGAYFHHPRAASRSQHVNFHFKNWTISRPKYGLMLFDGNCRTCIVASNIT